MGRLKRKRPASPKKKGRKKLPKTDNRNKRELRESAVEGAAQKIASPPKEKEVVVAKKMVPKPIKPSGRKIELAFWGKTTQFLREVKIELKKVTWPSRKETIGSTVVVIILVIIVSAFLGLVDMGLSSLIRLVLQ